METAVASLESLAQATSALEPGILPLPRELNSIEWRKLLHSIRLSRSGYFRKVMCDEFSETP